MNQGVKFHELIFVHTSAFSFETAYISIRLDLLSILKPRSHKRHKRKFSFFLRQCLRPLVFFTLVSVFAYTCFLYTRFCVCVHFFSLFLRLCQRPLVFYILALCLRPLVFFTLASVSASTCFLYYCVCVSVHLFSLLLHLCLRPLVFFTLASVSVSTCFLYSCVYVCVHLFFFTLALVSASALELGLRR